MWSFRGRSTTAAKWAYELWIGPVMAGQLVFRVCGDERCVAPGHLSAGRKAGVQALQVAPEPVVRAVPEKTWGKPYVKPQKRVRKIKANGVEGRTVINLTDKFLGWQITDHARSRAEELGFTMNDVLLAAGDPENVYETPEHGPDNYVHQRGKLALGVVRGPRVIKTVLLRTERTWAHGVDSVAGL